MFRFWTSPANGPEDGPVCPGVATAYKLWINRNMAVAKGVATGRRDMETEGYS